MIVRNIIDAALVTALLGSWYFFVIRGTSIKDAWLGFRWNYLMSPAVRVTTYMKVLADERRKQLTPYDSKLSDVHKAKFDLINVGDLLVNCYLRDGDERHLDRYIVLQKIIAKIDFLEHDLKLHRFNAEMQVTVDVNDKLNR